MKGNGGKRSLSFITIFSFFSPFSFDCCFLYCHTLLFFVMIVLLSLARTTH